MVGEQYVQQSGIYDGEPYRNRYHSECYDDCADEGNHYGEWEFTPYSADYPERVKAIVDARRIVSDAICDLREGTALEKP